MMKAVAMSIIDKMALSVGTVARIATLQMTGLRRRAIMNKRWLHLVKQHQPRRPRRKRKKKKLASDPKGSTLHQWGELMLLLVE